MYYWIYKIISFFQNFRLAWNHSFLYFEIDKIKQNVARFFLKYHFFNNFMIINILMILYKDLICFHNDLIVHWKFNYKDLAATPENF